MTNMILSAVTPANRGHQHPAPAFLIYGSAIRNRANSPGFTNMQFSNRQLNDGLSIMSLGLLEKIRRRGPLTSLDDLCPVHPPVSRWPRVDPPWPKFLIATFTNSKFESSHCKHARYQNSNRNKSRFSGNVAPAFRPEVSRHSSLVTRHFRYEVWLFSAPDATLVTSNRPWQTSPRMTDRPANETCGE